MEIRKGKQSNQTVKGFEIEKGEVFESGGVLYIADDGGEATRLSDGCRMIGPREPDSNVRRVNAYVVWED